MEVCNSKLICGNGNAGTCLTSLPTSDFQIQGKISRFLSKIFQAVTSPFRYLAKLSREEARRFNSMCGAPERWDPSTRGIYVRGLR